MFPDDVRVQTTAWLVQHALSCADPDDERRWQAVAVLQDRGDLDVFERAKQLLANPEPRARVLGVDVLGQNLARRKTFHDEAVTELLHLLEREREPVVLAAIGHALGHRRDVRAVEPLSALRSHPDACVRYGVVHGLLTHADPLAVHALIELSGDQDSDVRDWATFGLGTQIDVDTPELREALASRLRDSDEDTREEAVAGLARRRDARGVTALIDYIDDGWDGACLRDAVEAFPHPDVLRALEEAADDGNEDWQTWARGVLERFGGQQRAGRCGLGAVLPPPEPET